MPQDRIGELVTENLAAVGLKVQLMTGCCYFY